MLKIINSITSIYILQMRIVLLIILATIIPLYSIIIFVKLTTNIPIDDLVRDQYSVANIPPYIGLFSNIGLLIWSSCAAICIFSYTILKQVNKNRVCASFLLYSGLLTSLLILDDFFLFHELVFPNYLRIKEHIIYLVYIIITLLIFINYRKVIQKTEALILLSAIICFGISIVADKIPYNIPVVLEDTFKLIGITTWTTYFVRLCSQEIRAYVLAKK